MHKTDDDYVIGNTHDYSRVAECERHLSINVEIDFLALSELITHLFVF